MIDHSSLLPKLAKSLPVSAIYGDEDGLFDTSHVDAIASIVDKKHFTLVHGAGHSVFLDQPTQFFTVLVKTLRAKT